MTASVIYTASVLIGSNFVCRIFTAVADANVSTFRLVRHAVQELLGPIQMLWRLEALRRVPILYTLTDEQLATLAGCMAVRHFGAGDIVFSMGDPGPFRNYNHTQFTQGRTCRMRRIAPKINNQ